MQAGLGRGSRHSGVVGGATVCEAPVAATSVGGVACGRWRGRDGVSSGLRRLVLRTQPRSDPIRSDYTAGARLCAGRQSEGALKDSRSLGRFEGGIWDGLVMEYFLESELEGHGFGLGESDQEGVLDAVDLAVIFEDNLGGGWAVGGIDGGLAAQEEAGFGIEGVGFGVAFGGGGFQEPCFAAADGSGAGGFEFGELLLEFEFALEDGFAAGAGEVFAGFVADADAWVIGPGDFAVAAFADFAEPGHGDFAEAFIGGFGDVGEVGGQAHGGDFDGAGCGAGGDLFEGGAAAAGFDPFIDDFVGCGGSGEGEGQEQGGERQEDRFGFHGAGFVVGDIGASV
jgi:hypothetical protein